MHGDAVNILLVEDHSDTRRVLSTLLGRSGHEILTATGVRDALVILANTRVNVLLSDLGLADGDGLELVAKAKALQPKVRAIALTARGSQNDFAAGKKAGFDHYLTKPFDFHELRTLLDVVRKSAA
jgi:DNA-binding response OmpR family regulator